jgi:hypothetical protein
VTLEVSYSTDGRKLVRLNGTERIRAAELSSFLNVVMFTPDDLALVKGSPSVRRSFSIMEISQVSPALPAVDQHMPRSLARETPCSSRPRGKKLQSNSAAIDRLLEVMGRGSLWIQDPR